MHTDTATGAPTGVSQLLHHIGDEPGDLIQLIVAAAKDHLEADLSFLSEFEGEWKMIRRAAAGERVDAVDAGTSFPLKDTYCYRMAKGELPHLLHDARNDDRVKDLDITRQLNIGAYISVPVVIPGGRTFGSLCCISHEADYSVSSRDVRFMRVLADLVGAYIGRREQAADELNRKAGEVRRVIDDQGPRMVFQPIVNLDAGAIVGAEALARFDAKPQRTPDLWFAEAWRAGLGVDLEISAARSAVAHLPQIPAGVYLSVNVSPDTLQSNALSDLLAEVPPDRLVVEVTEHAVIKEYEPLIEAIGRLKRRGIRLAVDDVGAGYSGLNHIVRVQPALVKLDLALTRDVHRDPVKQALAAASAVFASRTGVEVVAEGIESGEEAGALRELGIRYGQGYYFARPGPLPLRVDDAATNRRHA